MKKIKYWFMDMVAGWHKKVWQHQQVREGAPLGQDSTLYHAEDLPQVLARMDRDREKVIAQYMLRDLVDEFDELFLPSGWGVILSAAKVLAGASNRSIVRVKYGSEVYTIAAFVQDHIAYVGLFSDAPKGAAADTSTAVVHAQSKEDLLIAMIAMHADEEKKYA